MRQLLFPISHLLYSLSLSVTFLQPHSYLFPSLSSFYYHDSRLPFTHYTLSTRVFFFSFLLLLSFSSLFLFLFLFFFYTSSPPFSPLLATVTTGVDAVPPPPSLLPSLHLPPFPRTPSLTHTLAPSTAHLAPPPPPPPPPPLLPASFPPSLSPSLLLTSRII